MQKIFFTSDTHYGHANIIKHCNRPFSSVDEMNSAIVDRFNQVWVPGATLYHLGDIALGRNNASTRKLALEFLDRIHFEKVIILWGNHDKIIDHRKIIADALLLPAEPITARNRVCLCHYPLRSWRNRSRGAYHLFGHTHGSLPGIDRSMDVGVDTNNMYPYSWEEVNEKLSKIPIGYVHHETN